jgi:hypothetical protein
MARDEARAVGAGHQVQAIRFTAQGTNERRLADATVFKPRP